MITFYKYEESGEDRTRNSYSVFFIFILKLKHKSIVT